MKRITLPRPEFITRHKLLHSALHATICKMPFVQESSGVPTGCPSGDVPILTEGGCPDGYTPDLAHPGCCKPISSAGSGIAWRITSSAPGSPFNPDFVCPSGTKALAFLQQCQAITRLSARVPCPTSYGSGQRDGYIKEFASLQNAGVFSQLSLDLYAPLTRNDSAGAKQIVTDASAYFKNIDVNLVGKYDSSVLPGAVANAKANGAAMHCTVGYEPPFTSYPSNEISTLLGMGFADVRPLCDYPGSTTPGKENGIAYLKQIISNYTTSAQLEQIYANFAKAPNPVWTVSILGLGTLFDTRAIAKEGLTAYSVISVKKQRSDAFLLRVLDWAQSPNAPWVISKVVPTDESQVYQILRDMN
jgi:hypothetical protein